MHYNSRLKDQLDAHVQRIADDSFNRGLQLGQNAIEKIIVWLDPQNPDVDWHAHAIAVKRWAARELEKLEEQKQ